jgi:hypothetical protein
MNNIRKSVIKIPALTGGLKNSFQNGEVGFVFSKKVIELDAEINSEVSVLGL